MKINKKVKKTLVISIMLILLGVTITPAVSSIEVPIDNNESTLTTANGDTEYYAVIAACVQYMDAGNNLPISTYSIKSLNRALLQANLDLESENDWNIKCLINGEATVDAILNALDWAASNVDDNDVFLFSWQGHGSEVPDIDGDESLFGFLDRWDEVICPYDCHRDYNGDLQNYITDDTLGQKFDAIQAKNTKGMVLMFESCLSAGMIGDQAFSDIDQNGDGLVEENEAEVYNNAVRSDFTTDSLGDPDGPGRMVIVSTASALRNTLGRGSYVFGFTMTWTIAHALKKGIFGPADDKNNDGWVSAQEAFSWSRPRIILENSLFWIVVWGIFFIEEYEYASAIGDPDPINVAINATLWTMFEFVYVQVITRLSTGHFMFNWAHKKDQLNGDLPLIKLNSNGGTPDEEDIEIPALAEKLWTMHPPYEELSDAFKSVVTEEQYNSYSWEDLNPEDLPPLSAVASYERDGNNKKMIYFHGEAKNAPPEYTYSWDFNGDGIEDSDKQNPTYTYEEKGTHKVTLTVTDGADRTDDDTINIKVGKAKSKTLDLVDILERLKVKTPFFKQLLLLLSGINS